MYKFLEKVLVPLKMAHSGMAANLAAWTGQSVNPELIQQDVDEVNAMDKELTDIEQLLAQKKLLARQLAEAKKEKIDNLTLKIKGIHSEQKEKWIEYGIEPDKPRQSKSAPAAVLNLLITDDSDGEGFVLQIEKRDAAADIYIWEKGIATNSEDTATIPVMIQFKETTKTCFVDDDIVKGKRYFYRVRAYNGKGYGPWSQVVSRVCQVLKKVYTF